jgi:DNA-binding MarR family transcriptional regulator
MAIDGRGRACDPDEISDAIIVASRVLLEVSMSVAETASRDLNVADLQVLALLDRLGPQRLVDLADALDVSPTSATRLADRLTERGMVNRVRQSTDRREVRLGLSAEGAQLVTAIRRHRRRIVVSRLKGLPIADQFAAIDLLARICGDEPRAEAASG